MSIFQIINEINNGEIVLLRDFVWDEDAITKLFDSLFRGYPVGIVLLWETYQSIQFRPFVRDYTPGIIHNFDENKPGKRLKLVLDGQQRLSSIYVALHGTFNGNRSYLDILSGRESDDYSELKFEFKFAADQEITRANQHTVATTAQSAGGGSKTDELSYWARLSDIVGRHPRDIKTMISELVQKLNLSDVDEIRMGLNIQTVGYALSENSELLKTQIIDSNVPATDEKRKSAFDILEIFVRINTQGIQLKTLRPNCQHASPLLD